MRPVVTIDGPAASGKSTTARGIARRLNLLYVDSGAMYRALALKAIHLGIHVDDEAAIVRLLTETHVSLAHGEAGARVLLDGVDVTLEVRDERVGTVASGIARIPAVRHYLVAEQRALAVEGGVVMEGRDIGTVVLPDAEVKIFLVASTDARASRRQLELEARGIDVALNEVRQRIEERDQRDREREESPLVAAEDAVTIDTTDLTIEQQIEAVLERVALSKNPVATEAQDGE